MQKDCPNARPQEFGIPEFILRRYVKKLASDQMATMEYALHRKVFNDEMKNDLAQYYIDLVKVNNGLSPEKVK